MRNTSLCCFHLYASLTAIWAEWLYGRVPHENHLSSSHLRVNFGSWAVPDHSIDYSALPSFRIEKNDPHSSYSRGFREAVGVFRSQGQEFRKKAEDEKKELDRRLAMPWASSKYPTAADSARGLLQYYQMKEAEFAQRSKSYHSRATNLGSNRDSVDCHTQMRF